ncbi:hypothetical protein NQ314_011498 [Rhamnusium bicolor]|uniref:Uncharacterized protein n=1 Tax=Rhamnusium bicolor TaxID=1586634 RepID=A0AAV8XIU9_9CUCU|nr:hypothetical protein NQ314_011498 [Rhamnusium bicolor]
MNTSCFYGKRPKSSSEKGSGNGSDDPDNSQPGQSGIKKIGRDLQKKEKPQYFYSSDDEYPVDDSDSDPDYIDEDDNVQILQGSLASDDSEYNEMSDENNEENLQDNPSGTVSHNYIWQEVGQSQISFDIYDKDAELLADIDLDQHYQIYRLFLSDDIIMMMETETNRYAEYCLEVKN